MNARIELDETACRQNEIDAFRREFLRYAAMDDLSQPCPIGRLMVDFDGSKLRESVWQVVADAMSEKREFIRRSTEYLCKRASWDADAKALLLDLAEHWAEQRSEL
jgi:hypothetical protein